MYIAENHLKITIEWIKIVYTSIITYSIIDMIGIILDIKEHNDTWCLFELQPMIDD